MADLDSGNWVIMEKDTEGRLFVIDLVADFMSKGDRIVREKDKGKIRLSFM